MGSGVIGGQGYCGHGEGGHVTRGVAADSLLTDLALARGPLHSDAMRDDPQWLAAAIAAGAKAVAVSGDRIATAPEACALGWRPLAAESGGTPVLLDAGGPQAPNVALLLDEPASQAHDGARLASLREIGAELDADEAALATTAVALAQWHRRHPRCSRCGTATTVTDAGWSRTCPDDGSIHFPRTDPAVIVLVRDPDDRALLGRRADWPETWFSTLAGFVEAGESVEHAVQREVFEESGVRVSPAKLAYRGSQPWPFPNSLMLGFHAWSVDGDEPTPDGAEIIEARWFTRAQIAELGARGAVRIPPQVSIARHLIEDWFGGALDASWSRSSAVSSR